MTCEQYGNLTICRPPERHLKWRDDFHCKARCRDGRQCGGRWLLGRDMGDWYGFLWTCCFCGQNYGVGIGKNDDPASVRAEFLALREQEVVG